MIGIKKKTQSVYKHQSVPVTNNQLPGSPRDDISKMVLNTRKVYGQKGVKRNPTMPNDLTADVVLEMDIVGLTQDTTPDGYDVIPTQDPITGELRKVSIDNIIGIEKTEVLTVGTDGQTMFVLSNIPKKVTQSKLNINSRVFDYGHCFTIAGTTLTLNSLGYDMMVGQYIALTYYY